LTTNIGGPSSNIVTLSGGSSDGDR